MKRVASELDALDGPEAVYKDLVIEGPLLCFQFAGGFDAESMEAFEELRSRIHTKTGENKMDE